MSEDNGHGPHKSEDTFPYKYAKSRPNISTNGFWATGRMLKDAVLSKGILEIPFRVCSHCKDQIYLRVIDDILFVDLSCKCYFKVPLIEKDWRYAAEFVNMHPLERVRIKIAKTFGVENI